MKQRRFTAEFISGAVDVARTSGRTHRQVAADLGIGLSTLTAWLSKSRDALPITPISAANGDMAAELKRLRRDNEVLRQERDILKKAAVFFAKEGSR